MNEKRLHRGSDKPCTVRGALRKKEKNVLSQLPGALGLKLLHYLDKKVCIRIQLQKTL